jgi:hypothetical protein
MKIERIYVLHFGILAVVFVIAIVISSFNSSPRLAQSDDSQVAQPAVPTEVEFSAEAEVATSLQWAIKHVAQIADLATLEPIGVVLPTENRAALAAIRWLGLRPMEDYVTRLSDAVMEFSFSDVVSRPH